MALTKEQINQVITDIYTQFLSKINTEREVLLSQRELASFSNPNVPHYQLWLVRVYRDKLAGISTEDRGALVKAIERRFHPDKLKNLATQSTVDLERNFAQFFLAHEAIDFPYSELHMQAKTRGHDNAARLPEQEEDPDSFEKNRLYQLYLRLNSVFQESSRYPSELRFLTNTLYYLINAVAIISLVITGTGLTVIVTLSNILKNLAEGVLVSSLPKFTPLLQEFLSEQRSSSIDSVFNSAQLIMFFTHATIGIELEDNKARQVFGRVDQYMRSNENAEIEIDVNSMRFLTYLKVGYQAIYAAAVQELPADENRILSVLKRIATVILFLALQTFIVVPSTLAILAGELLRLYAIFPLILAAKTLAFGLLNTPLYMLDGARYLKNALVSLFTSKPAASNENQPAANNQNQPVANSQNQLTWIQDADNTHGAASMGFFDANSGRSTPDIQGQQPSAQPTAAGFN